MSIEKLEKNEKKKLGHLLIIITLFSVLLIILNINRSQSYQDYDLLEFNSSGSRLFANLYHPTNELGFQEKHPLVIYCHGIASQRDYDLRIPIELTKRGFFVAALDYQGHGGSEGTIFKLNPTNGRLALAYDCSNLLDYIETLPIYSHINSSQIGLIGHSLGGMVVLLNGALDTRFSVTVTWAPLVNYGVIEHPNFEGNMPIDIINESNTENLLVIANIGDEALNYTQHAEVAANLTNGELYLLNDPELGGGHGLLADSSLIETINWFESHFFGSETINGPIILSYLYNYVFLLVGLALIVLMIYYIVFLSGSFFEFKDPLEENTVDINFLEEEINGIVVKKQIIKVIFYITLFIITWLFFAQLYGLLGIFYSSIVQLIGYAITKLIIFLSKSKEERKEFSLKKLLKSEFKINIIIYGLLASAVFQMFYFAYSISYPFAFMWTMNLYTLFLSSLAFPIFLTMEILFRKVIYPQLKFIKSESSKSNVIIILAVIVHLLIFYFTSNWAFSPSLLFSYLLFLITIIINTVIYQKTKRFLVVLIFSFDVVQIFFAVALSSVFGLGSATSLFI
ncbi:MAG: alpha/beta fold hydrolase [Promethearchaeota archaeon]|nr:MAG: alpha/beta fold hydrolase [Candidatus Lokiarchaeota archaeon]